MTEAWETIICPICRKEIHRQFSSPIQSRGRVSSRDYQAASDMLTAMMLAAEAEHQRMIMAAQDACVEHYRARHRIRFALARRFGWSWLLKRRWPWSRIPGETFDFSERANA